MRYTFRQREAMLNTRWEIIPTAYHLAKHGGGMAYGQT